MKQGTASFFARKTNPITIGLMIVIAVVSVLAFSNRSAALSLALSPLTAQGQPWTVITYGFGSLDIIGAVFACLWLFSMGSILESDLGGPKYVLTYVVFTLLSGLLMIAGASLNPIPFVILNAFVPISALTVIWGARYPTMEAMLFGFIKVQARWIAFATAGLVVLTVPPTLSIFALIPLILAWAFGANKIPFLPYGSGGFRKKTPTTEYKKHYREGEDYYFDAQKRKIEREEREKLKKLFESSNMPDDPSS